MVHGARVATTMGNPLAIGAGAGSFLGASAIIGLSTTITSWQALLALTPTQIGLLSGALSFAIAVGSIVAGTIGEFLGRQRVYQNLLMLVCLGFLVCACAQNFATLLVGIIITGLTTGIDMPIALSLVSDPRYAGDCGARNVSFTQSGWQLGILATMCFAFSFSWIKSSQNCRPIFITLAVLSIFTAFYRQTNTSVFSGTAISGTQEQQQVRVQSESDNSGIRGKLPLFFSILFFYVFWNFLGNTWGQFQTFIFVNAHASQSLATGMGIVLYAVAFLSSFVITASSGTKYETPVFFVGSLLTMLSLVVLSFTGNQLAWLIALSFTLNAGTVLTGEATSKVWIQTLFHGAKQRTVVQGVILAVSRIACSLLALVTPQMVMPSTIRQTMIVFFGFALISFLCGVNVLRLKKSAGIRNNGK